MKALVFERFGEPSDVLQLLDRPTPEPSEGQVRVRMIASPINPSDLLNIRGRYVITPRLPAVPGFEGVGVVDAAGPGMLGRFLKGKRVLAINGTGGDWAEYAIIPAKQARPIPADIPDEQAASMFVNPATALAIVRHVLQVPKNAWLLQSAAGSELGKMIIRLGKHDGFRTLNVVRRPETRTELEALGADAVISPAEGDLPSQIRRIVGDAGVHYAIDAVGGDTGTALFDSLAQPGRLVIYGSLSGEPVRVDPRRMISGRRVLESFWLGDWIRRQSIPKALKIFSQIAQLLRLGVFETQVGPQFPLHLYSDALAHAERQARAGKVLLRLDATP
jgi:NADPH:quinone reductase-like Zn-dependent oxidoreductase